MKTHILCVAAMAAVLGCSSAPPPATIASRDSIAAPTPIAAADSMTSMTFLLERFQAVHGSRAPADIEGGAPDLETLVRRFTSALERRDGAALEALIVTAPEFGHLYFPESVFMRPPYELDPAIVWMQLDAATTTGMRRALQQYGGTPLGYAGVICAPPDVRGSVRIHGCDVLRVDLSGDTLRERLFGPILERAGRFKFLSLQNRL